MRLGGGSVSFRPTLPVSISNEILALIDENAGGVGAQVVFTDVEMDVSRGDAAILNAASFVGVITKRSSRLTLEFDGLGWWLDTYITSAVTFSSASPTTVLTELLANGLTVGTVSGGSNISRTFPAFSVSRREALDACASAGGWEYRINPDGTVDAGTNLFRTSPEVIVLKDPSGEVGDLRGLDGGIISQSLDVGNLTTKMAALTQGTGSAIKTGEATQSLNLRTRTGGTPDLTRVVDAPSDQATNASALATNVLNLQGLQRSIDVSSTTHLLPRFARPGDDVYIYDVPDGLVDESNAVPWGGGIISPVRVRYLGSSRPVESGSVFIRPNAASPTYIDVTPWVSWESGETTITVGTWNPPTGPANRSNPAVEERIAGIGLPSALKFGATSGTTDANGYLTITHGLGTTPTGAIASSNANNAATMRPDLLGATTFRVRAFTAAGVLVTSTSVDVAWVAFA